MGHQRSLQYIKSLSFWLSVESLMSGWSSLINSDGIRNVGSNLSNIGSQLSTQAQEGYSQAAQRVMNASSISIIITF